MVIMEITTVAKNILKCKGKSSSALIANSLEDIEKLTKTTETDVVIFLTGSVFSLNNEKVQNNRLIIAGSGEYEIGGIKISGYQTKEGIVYFLVVDEVEIFFGTAKSSSSLDKKREAQVAVFLADGKVSDTFVTDLAPSYLVLCGEKADELGKEFGKEATLTTTKLVITREKLPEEMETVVLS